MHWNKIQTHVIRGFFLAFFLSPLFGFSQISLDSLESKLAHFGGKILVDSTNQERLAANDSFTHYLEWALESHASYAHEFDQVKNLSALRAPNDKFRIYTWVVPLTNGSYQYNGYLYLIPRKGSPYYLKLKPEQHNTSQAMDKVLETDQWYGALYYKVLHHKRKRKHYYTLLGWHGQDATETQKLVDVLVFDAFDEPFFGYPMIQIKENEKALCRYILRYSAKAFATLRYEPRYKMIVMDNLQPTVEGAEGMYQYYGPDFTYNGLKYKKGKWIFEENIDVRNLGEN